MTTKKPPYVSIYISLLLKNPPEDYHGLIGDKWNIGKDKPVELSGLITGAVKIITDFYLTTHADVSTDTICSELQIASEKIGRMKIEETKR